MRSSRTAILVALALAGSAARIQAMPPPSPPPPAIGGWNLQGNAQTQGGNFLGTTTDQPLELRAANQRVLRFENLHLVGTDGPAGHPFDCSGPSVLGGNPINWLGANAPSATIAGGGLRIAYPETWDVQGNAVTDRGGTVGGGMGNHAGDDNPEPFFGDFGTVSGGAGSVATHEATVGGGWGNQAADGGSVAGGSFNRAIGELAAVPGGLYNAALGIDSLAAGRGATVRDTDHITFVWSDTSDAADFTSTARNQFLVRAAGGVGIDKNDPFVALDVQGEGRFSSFVSVGAMGAGWFTQLCLDSDNRVAFCSSSLRYKTGVESFKGGMRIVERLDPISFTWRDAGVRDVGLAAEDVERVEPRLVTYNQEGEVEGVKYDRILVVLIDAVQDQQAQLERQRRRIEALRERLAHERAADADTARP